MRPRRNRGPARRSRTRPRGGRGGDPRTCRCRRRRVPERAHDARLTGRRLLVSGHSVPSLRPQRTAQPRSERDRPVPYTVSVQRFATAADPHLWSVGVKYPWPVRVFSRSPYRRGALRQATCARCPRRLGGCPAAAAAALIPGAITPPFALFQTTSMPVTQHSTLPSRRGEADAQNYKQRASWFPSMRERQAARPSCSRASVPWLVVR
jgi:hypothetical protein